MSTSGIFWQSASTISNLLWATLESLAILIGGYFVVHKAVKTKKIASELKTERVGTLEEEVRNLTAQDGIKDQLIEVLQYMKKIDYAIFNTGKTGLKNRVDDLWDMVPGMKEDIAVILDRTKNL